jgi:hypothetical protein
MDQLKNGAVQIRLKVDFPLGAILKEHQNPETSEWFGTANTYKGA